MQKEIIICGAGGFAREVFSWLPKEYKVRAFYSETKQDPIYDIPVVSDLSSFSKCVFVVAIGDPLTRERIWRHAMAAGLSPCEPIIHPKATVGHNVHIGHGSIVCPGAVITCDVVISAGVILNIGATVGHDVTIQSFTTVSPGANISGHVFIGNFVYIGTNASVRENNHVGSHAVVGMGAAVIQNIPTKETWAGVPAKRIK